MPLLRSLIMAAAQYALASVMLSGYQVRRRLGRLAGGVALFALGGLAAYLTMGFGLAGLFFYLAGLTDLVRPALITGFISALFAALLAVEGWRLARRE